MTTEYITPTEMSRYADISLARVMKAIHQRELPAVADNAGGYLLDIEAAISYCDAKRIEASPLVRLRKHRILVVDDDADFGSLVLDMLSSEPTFWGRLAGSIFEAKTLYSEFRPHVLVVDAQLPDGFGSEVIEYAKLSGGAFPTVIGVTALSSRKNITALMDSGAEEVLIKPVPPDRLLTLIWSYIRSSESNSQKEIR